MLEEAVVFNILNDAHKGIWVYDKNFTITFINQYFVDHTNIDVDQLYHKDLNTLFSINNSKDNRNRKPNPFQEEQNIQGTLGCGSFSIIGSFQIKPVWEGSTFKGGHIVIPSSSLIPNDPFQEFPFLKSLFTYSKEAFLITDNNLEKGGPTILKVSKGFEEMTGYKASEITGKTPGILQGPLTDNKAIQNLKNTLEKGRPYWSSTFNYKKDGSPFLIQWEIMPLWNSEGEPLYYLALQKDISKEDKLESVLKETQKIAKIGGWRYEFNNDKFLATREVRSIFNVNFWDSLGLADIAPYFPEKDRARIQNAFQKLKEEGESFNLDLQILSPGQTPLWVRIFGQPYIDNGTITEAGGTLQQITEQKEVELANQEKQAFIEKVIHNSPNLIHVFDYGKKEFIYHNNRVPELLGYSFQEIGEKFPNGVFDLLHPDELAQYDQLIKDNLELKDGEINYIEFRMKAKSGGYKWFLGADTPFKRDEDGNVVQILSTVQDITYQKNTEHQLSENQKFIESVAENSPFIIHIFDYDQWDTIYANRRIIDELGYSQSEIREIEKNPRSICHPEDIPAISKQHEDNVKLGDKEVNVLEYRVKNKAGKWEWLRNRDNVFKRDENGNVKQVLGVVENITEQKHIWQSLEKNVALFRQLFDNAPVGILMLDKDYNIQGSNQGFEAIFGYSSDETVGQKVNDLIVSENYKEEASFISEKVMKGNTYHYETYRIDKNGHYVPVLIYGVPVFYGNETLNIFGIYVDISERIKVEEDLKERTHELLRSNAELEQFAYVTSHNLRSPLVNLNSLLQFFDTSELKDSHNQYVFEKFQESVYQLDETINDLVDIVGKKKALSQPKEKIEFARILDKVKNHLNEEIRESGAEIVSDFSPVPSIIYLRSFLESILQNLISNAIKYRSDKRHLQVKLETEPMNQFICLKVSDNGSGIDLNKHREKLFGLYKRFHDQKAGKGLGLYLVKSQVESLGGQVSIESEVDQGTTFYLYLKDFTK